MILVSTRDPWWMKQCDALLLSEGIDAAWIPDRASGGAGLDVAVSDCARVSTGLSALLGEEIEKRLEAQERVVSTAPLWLQSPFAFGLGMAFLLLVFFWLTGGAEGASDWFQVGRLTRQGYESGTWYQFVTAATLHADLRHAAGNAGFLWILSWAGAERTGEGTTALAWLLTAVAGFVVSLALTDVHATVGASGGLFGLLGFSMGHGIKHGTSQVRTAFAGRERLRALGASVMLLAFTAFSPGSNIAAHCGGFFAGALFGLTTPRVPASRGYQIVLGVSVAVVLWGAWALAARDVLGAG